MVSRCVAGLETGGLEKGVGGSGSEGAGVTCRLSALNVEVLG